MLTQNLPGMLLLELNPRLLAYPCWRFDHAQGFLDVTEYLVYNGVGHLTEQNPVNLVEHHLPPRIIRKLDFTMLSLLSLTSLRATERRKRPTQESLARWTLWTSHESLWSDLPLQERDGI